MAQAVRLVRDLVNTPAEDMGPQELSDVAREQAELFGGEFDEWVGDELLAQNFPAIHAVGRAAARPPRLIEVRWGNPKHPRIAIVGKGVCFDSGGLDIKGAEGMRLMKKDMGGAAHAIALARLIMQRKLPVSLQLLVPTVENAISGNAYRPGDVVRTRGGPQHRGRQHRCRGPRDPLRRARLRGRGKARSASSISPRSPARRAWPSAPSCPVLFCNDEAFAAKLEAAAGAQQDPIWRLPLWRNYRRLFSSDVADFANSGKGGYAGAIVAALFLDYFVPADIPWAHFDTFAWNDASRPGRPAGGEALGLRAARGAATE